MRAKGLRRGDVVLRDGEHIEVISTVFGYDRDGNLEVTIYGDDIEWTVLDSADIELAMDGLGGLLP